LSQLVYEVEILVPEPAGALAPISSLPVLFYWVAVPHDTIILSDFLNLSHFCQKKVNALFLGEYRPSSLYK
jgi:hypothetical protein